jgi:C4-type Zn-finger protein
MTEENKILCPDCGAEMNYHALKIDYGLADQAVVDPYFGGVLKEAHTCPECGRAELRVA